MAVISITDGLEGKIETVEGPRRRFASDGQLPSSLLFNKCPCFPSSEYGLLRS